MPRNGSGIYSTPVGTDGISNATIASTPYNINVHDVESDLNAPRPIVAGGTGATTGSAALANLGGETANQGVLNYDTFPFASGSFWSTPGAFGAPVAGYNISGFCVTPNAGSVVLEARVLQDPGIAGSYIPGRVFVREKWNGVWGQWTNNIRGGDLATSRTATPSDGVVYFGNTGTTYLFYSGGNFSFNGGNLSVPGGGNNLTVGGTITAGNGGTTGAYYFGNAGTKNLYFDGASYAFNGGRVVVADPTASSTPSTGALTVVGGLGVGGNLNISGGIVGASSASFATQISGRDITASRGDGTGVYNFGGTTRFLYYDGTNFNFGGAPLATIREIIKTAGSAVSASPAALQIGHLGAASETGIVIRPAADSTWAIGFANAAGSFVGNIVTTAAATAYNTSSSAELKEDLKSFDAGRIVDETNVYNFAWKQSLQQITAGEPIERAYGVIAQQAVEVYPQAVTHDEVRDWWGIDYSKYVPVLLQELKALRARVAALEGRLTAKPA